MKDIVILNYQNGASILVGNCVAVTVNCLEFTLKCFVCFVLNGALLETSHLQFKLITISK